MMGAPCSSSYNCHLSLWPHCFHEWICCATCMMRAEWCPALLPCSLQVPWLVIFAVLTLVPQTAVCYYLMLAAYVSDSRWQESSAGCRTSRAELVFAMAFAPCHCPVTMTEFMCNCND
jgi:hypothetical protein